MLNIKEEKDGISIKVTVVPNSSKSMAVAILDGILKIKLNSPPIEGKANKEVIEVLSKLINLPKTSMEIVRGDKNKVKTLLLKGNQALLREKIQNIKF